MKLCQNCKHAATNPLAQLYVKGYAIAMCGHPDAKRSVVDGSLEVTCVQARGDGAMGATNLSICCDARLFEERPPEPKEEMKPYQVIETWTPEKRSLWRRIFG